ncbi:MAG: GTP cyclohydrolase I [Deltaproteobacteria bacterium]|nr:GTP cyclohydrolase I [Deltaproteobacteria bacterium]
MSADPTPSALARTRPVDAPRFKAAVRELLLAAGFELDPVHLAGSADHMLALWRDRLLAGYDVDIRTQLGTGFADPRTDLVVVRDIAVFGLCPHHLVPWRGVAHVGYLPGGRLFGFGGIARLCDALCHRLTYQEWFTRDVAEAMVRDGGVRAAACAVQAEQLCLILGENRRGEERVVTTAFAGSLAEDASGRLEFLRTVGLA